MPTFRFPICHDEPMSAPLHTVTALRPNHRYRVLIGAVVLGLLTACGSSDTAVEPTAVVTTAPAATDTTATPTTPVPTTAPPTTTTTTTVPDPSEDIYAYVEPGPYPVGVTTASLERGNLVEIWYPSAVPAGTETYDIRDFTPEAIQELLTGDVDATFTYAATRDAPIAEGTFPIVLFSHGFTGIRLQSTFLTAHLASWGMIVAAPDHPSRDLPNVLGFTASGERSEATADLLATLDLLESTAGGSGALADLIGGGIDTGHVATLGHSAGGGTVLDASLDDRISGYVSMAAGGPEDAAAYPPLPSFFLAGAIDAVVPPSTRTLPAFEAAPAPAWYWEIEATGHNGFDDFCTFGNGTGIIGVAEASGLGPLLDSQPQLRTLGEDGCIAPAAPVEQAMAIIRHGVTAWLRWNLGIDAQLTGFGPAIADGYDLGVVALEK